MLKKVQKHVTMAQHQAGQWSMWTPMRSWKWTHMMMLGAANGASRSPIRMAKLIAYKYSSEREFRNAMGELGLNWEASDLLAICEKHLAKRLILIL